MRGIRRAGYVGLILMIVPALMLATLPRASDAELPADRPLAPISVGDRTLRLAVMGTSLTARYGWPRDLAQALSACLPQPVELRVFAEPGMGSAWGATVVAEVARFAPDIVLIEFAANDSDLRQLRSIGASRATHAGLIAALRADGRNPAIALMTMNPAFGLRGALRPQLDRFHAMYAALAAEAGTGLIDLAPRWRALLRTQDRRTILPDGLHPTESAQGRVMSAGLLPALGAALAPTYPDCAGLGSS